MIDLDDPGALAAADPGGMLGAVAGLAGQCSEGYRAGLDVEGLPVGDGITAVAFCGMGGSAVAGDVIRVLYAERLRVPIQVVRTPVLPEFCGPHTFVLCSSYSGNTAETLACFEEAVRRGSRVIAVTSGGELARRAREEGVAIVPAPEGFMPRAALGHLALGSLGALEAAGVVPTLAADVEETSGELSALAAALGPEVRVPDNPAKRMAIAMGDRFPVIWGAEGIGAAAAARWKTQMNENAKVPAWASAIPELDHNEVVGWSQGVGERFYLVALRHEGEHPDMAERFPMSIEIAQESGLLAGEVRASGRSALARLLTLVMMGDYTSSYLGLWRGVDPTPVDAIARLKASLAEM